MCDEESLGVCTYVCVSVCVSVMRGGVESRTNLAQTTPCMVVRIGVGTTDKSEMLCS